MQDQLIKELKKTGVEMPNKSISDVAELKVKQETQRMFEFEQTQKSKN